MQNKPVMIAITNDGTSYEVISITCLYGQPTYLTVIDKDSVWGKRVEYWELQLIAYLKGTR